MDDDKRRLFREWIELYESGLLSIAFFSPGVVRWQTSGRWQGEIELRGLGPGKYKVIDYSRNIDLGTIDGGHPKLRVDFEKHLLLQVEKVRP